jgi:hypothetical protein
MKVKIGNYLNYIGPHQITNAVFWFAPKKIKDRIGTFLRYGVLELPQTKSFKFDDLLSFPPQTRFADFCDWVHSKRSQTIKVKIDRWDVWNMDRTMAYIILPLLRKVQDEKQGSPFVDDVDVPLLIRSTSAKPLTKKQIDCGEIDEFFHNRWSYVIGEMIFAFESYQIEDNFKTNQERENHQNRINNGFKLFGKYYMCLWT